MTLIVYIVMFGEFAVMTAKQNSVTTFLTGPVPNHREQEQRQTGGGCAGFCLHQVPRQDQVSHFFSTGFAPFLG